MKFFSIYLEIVFVHSSKWERTIEQASEWVRVHNSIPNSERTNERGDSRAVRAEMNECVFARNIKICGIYINFEEAAPT